MPRRLKFSTYRSGNVEEPIEVEINEDNVFYFKPTIPGMNLLNHLEAIDAPNNADAARGIKAFLREALVDDPAAFPDADPPIPEDNIDAFFTYLSNPDHHVDLPKLQDISNGIVEALAAGPPTQSSPKSDGGSATNGPGRTRKRSARAATSNA